MSEKGGVVDGADPGGDGGHVRTENQRGFNIDTRYPRSIEGILRMITLPIALLGVIFVIAAVFASVGGWFFFVGASYIIYVVIVFVIEMFIPGVYVHRLIDGVITMAYAGLWLLSAILNTAYGAINGNVLLGLAALCGYICCVLCVIQAILAIRTWKTFEGGRKGSQPIIII